MSGRHVLVALAALILGAIVVEFYFAAQGAFGVGTYASHETLGEAIQLGAILTVLATVAFPATRTRQDIPLAIALFALAATQTALTRIDGDLQALHGVNALLVTGAAVRILIRNRGLVARGER